MVVEISCRFVSRVGDEKLRLTGDFDLNLYIYGYCKKSNSARRRECLRESSRDNRNISSSMLAENMSEP